MDVISNENTLFHSSGSSLKGRKSKTSLRLKYEAEVEVIKRKLGSLEEIRAQLGLPQRKLCQLLLVDPSAWSRWIREGEDAPPHIYRQLQWYLALQEKYPALDTGFWLQTVARVAREPVETSIRERKVEELEREISELRVGFEKLTKKEESVAVLPQGRRPSAWILVLALALGGVAGFLISLAALG